MRFLVTVAALFLTLSAQGLADDYHVPGQGYMPVNGLPGMFYSGIRCVNNTQTYRIYNEYAHTVFADVSVAPSDGAPVLPFGLRFRFYPYTYTTLDTRNFDCSSGRFRALIVNVRFGEDKGPLLLSYQPVTQPLPAPVGNPSNPSGVGMWGVLQYNGPHADAARFLLQHVGGWQIYSDASRDVPPPTPASLSCMRDSYIYAAAQSAWAANAHVAVNMASAAASNIQGMMQALGQALSLCSNAASLGTMQCQTDWMSCDLLRQYASS